MKSQRIRKATTKVIENALQNLSIQSSGKKRTN
jgi:hypothetical protein